MPLPPILLLLILMIWSPCHSNSNDTFFTFEMLGSSYLMSFWKMNISLLFRPSVIRGPWAIPIVHKYRLLSILFVIPILAGTRVTRKWYLKSLTLHKQSKVHWNSQPDVAYFSPADFCKFCVGGLLMPKGKLRTKQCANHLSRYNNFAMLATHIGGQKILFSAHIIFTIIHPSHL